jgi:serine/threonine protein phosphatase 1
MKPLDLFVVGDVHGCYKTFRNLLTHWNRDTEQLIQLGDLLDRGNNNPQTIKLCRELQVKHGAVFLKGNHEQLALEYFKDAKQDHWLNKYGRKVLWQYTLEGRDFTEDILWISSFPLSWENERVFISHAGISTSPYCMDEKHPDGLLWNRSGIKNIGKLQVYGHTPIRSGTPEYDPESYSWNIDTGAYRGKKLSALRISPEGKVTEVVSVPTVREDIE